MSFPWVLPSHPDLIHVRLHRHLGCSPCHVPGTSIFYKWIHVFIDSLTWWPYLQALAGPICILALKLQKERNGNLCLWCVWGGDELRNTLFSFLVIELPFVECPVLLRRIKSFVITLLSSLSEYTTPGVMQTCADLTRCRFLLPCSSARPAAWFCTSVN